jgi:putative hydrolase of the HAD superfamily
MFKNYIFDLYGTLVGIKTDEEKQMLWDKMSLFYGYHGARYTAEELKERFFELVNKAFSKVSGEENAEIQIEDIFYKLFKDKGIKTKNSSICYAAKYFRSLSTEEIYLYDGVIDFLKALKANGKKIFLLSNAQKEFTMPELVMLGLEDYFDEIFISSEYKYMKPSTEFFNVPIKKYNLKIKECIMIGNDPRSDIKGANNIGMKSLYIHTENSPQELLEINSTYKVMDGDFTKIKPMILKG